jgi:cell division protein ZapA
VPTVSFKINSKTYSVDCGEGQEAQIQGIAQMIDAKAAALVRQFGAVDGETLLLMVCILAMGELQKHKLKVGSLEKSLGLFQDGGLDEDRLAEAMVSIGRRLKSTSDRIAGALKFTN